MSEPRSNRQILEATAAELGNVNKVLLEDTQLFLDICKSKRDNLENEDLFDVCFWFKCLARTFLAQVDGVCWMMRQAVATHARRFELQLNEKKLDKIAEVRHNLPFLKGVKEAFKHFPSLFGLDFDAGISFVRFEAFRKLVEYRNGLTHPSLLIHTSPVGLLRVTRPAAGWFLLQIQRLLVECSEVAGIPLPELDEQPDRFHCRRSELAGVDDWTLELLQDQLALPPSEQMNYFLDSLMGDLSISQKFWSERAASKPNLLDQQAEIRNLLRVLFSGLEGGALVAASALKAIGIDSIPGGQLRGDHAEVAEATARTAELFSEHFGSGRSLSRKDPGWEKLPECRMVRNRVTHPEGLKDLGISLSEVRAIIDLSKWFAGDFLECMCPVSSAVSWKRLSEPILVGGSS